MSGEAPDCLKDSVVIVTGGTTGIGRAICLALARAGAIAVVVSRNAERVQAMVSELALVSGAERCLGLALDVSSEADTHRMASAALERYSRIDALVANAGVLRARNSAVKSMAEVAPAEWDEVIDINLRGMFLSNRAVLPSMLKRRRGDIINVSSIHGQHGRAFDGPYSASKFGAIGLTESLREEVRGSGIRIQAVLPGAVVTPIWEQNGFIRMPTNALPPERVADLILYMLALPGDTILPAPVIMPYGTSPHAA